MQGFRESQGRFDTAAPKAWTAAAAFNSCHSGRDYAPAFLAASRLDPGTLRKSEDCFVDLLFASAIELGAPLLRANFPRAWLDVNREPYELDPRMYSEPLPGYANSGTARVAGGLGTIPRLVSEGEEIYRLPLRLSDVLDRIETVYRPYHRALSGLLDEGRRRHGQVLLVDCHSMPSTASPGIEPADIVLGDRHGVACTGDITALAEDLFAAEGLKVVRNKPYAGGFIAQNYGAPAQGRHVLQIEINRALYLNERTFEVSRGFEPLRRGIRHVCARLLPALDDMFAPWQAAAE